ncbi:MAG: BREX-1 system phosphatase PglZ type B, partial [Deltaproteobacteria bacterium]|nr:BREX-1 system phosphatase PglZ type B [Deltaproteobacteria bacterium]
LADEDALEPEAARKRILVMEENHAGRRGTVWAELGYAPLAKSLGHLASAARACAEFPLNGGLMKDFEDGYVGGGWMADEGAIQALAELAHAGHDSYQAVVGALRAFYAPWVDLSAERLQETAATEGYPGGRLSVDVVPEYAPGDCILFVDGLRFDVAKRLETYLADDGLKVSETPVWAALPSVTATGKYAVAPVRELYSGAEAGTALEPSIGGTGAKLSSERLHDLLKSEGWTVFKEATDWDGEKRGWCERGDIDSLGHKMQAKLATSLKDILIDISTLIGDLFGKGWKRVFVVTDHGWLLIPGEGLRKTELKCAVAEDKASRFGSVLPGAQVPHTRLPWHWNPNRFFAYANGSSCFKAGEHYAHGGLSLQECLTLRLEVRPGDEAPGKKLEFQLEPNWNKGCLTVFADGDATGMSLDIRTDYRDPKTSVMECFEEFKSVTKEGKRLWRGIVWIQNSNQKGKKVFVVVIGKNGLIVRYEPIVVG